MSITKQKGGDDAMNHAPVKAPGTETGNKRCFTILRTGLTSQKVR